MSLRSVREIHQRVEYGRHRGDSVRPRGVDCVGLRHLELVLILFVQPALVGEARRREPGSPKAAAGVGVVAVDGVRVAGVFDPERECRVEFNALQFPYGLVARRAGNPSGILEFVLKRFPEVFLHDLHFGDGIGREGCGKNQEPSEGPPCQGDAIVEKAGAELITF